MKPKLGDYVLGTKYSDGDSGDPWAVGFYGGPAGIKQNKHLVVDASGTSILRPSGFGRVEQISRNTGDYLLGNSHAIEQSGCALWALVKALQGTPST